MRFEKAELLQELPIQTAAHLAMAALVHKIRRGVRPDSRNNRRTDVDAAVDGVRGAGQPTAPVRPLLLLHGIANIRLLRHHQRGLYRSDEPDGAANFLLHQKFAHRLHLPALLPGRMGRTAHGRV